MTTSLQFWLLVVVVKQLRGSLGGWSERAPFFVWKGT